MKGIIKNFYLYLILVFFFTTECLHNKKDDPVINRQTDLSKENAEILFKTYEHDFGKIEEGRRVKYVFRFENTGTGILVINSIITSCGCTVPEYDYKPVSPGGKGLIEVFFDSSGRTGMQKKTVRVLSNASEPMIDLKIKAEIMADYRE